MGRNFIIIDENSTRWHLGRIAQIKNTSLRNQNHTRILRPGDSSEKTKTWFSQVENDGEMKYRAESTNQEFGIQKRKLWEERRGQESRDTTAWTKNSWSVGNGSSTGSVLTETIAVSAGISISVEKLHFQIHLRILCSRMREMRREPEVREEKVPVVDCLDGHARITSRELAITLFVKSGILQNACSTRPWVIADLEKSARMHIVRLMNSLTKRSKKNDDKSAGAVMKKY